MTAIPSQVADLIERFERNLDTYRNPSYNETQLRREFIDPMFEALGWDVANRAGHAEAYKDVIHEDAIRVGSATKAPDYCFRIGGVRKFFLEAKKPAVNINADPTAAYQLRRYGWSSKLPVSILTDFEEFAVYDCRIRPNSTDKAAVARIQYFSFRDYAEQWDKIAGVFSKDAILQGSFDRFVEGTRSKRGTSEVDASFLAEIERWREILARNLALRNPALTARELNIAVQRTIDRIIFLRLCEDRGVESYGQLQALCGGPRIYSRLMEKFTLADQRYNSGLFHFEAERGREAPDTLTPSLEIDDNILHDILAGLYYPQSPYEFSVLPAEILGNIYEQFLGKVIRLTAGHRAKIEDKPEVKKAGGVYYTPAYIVDYIVKHTVGELCDNKTPRQVDKFCILDPACGSGSFLLGAFTFLLDYHRDWYVDHQRARHIKAKKLYQGRGGRWLLTSSEKKRILLNNIYGVDIDSQAVEVTKLSLLLKVLENESQETIERQLRFLRERALPDLSANIKCGNSLIAPDFYESQQLDMFDEEEQYQINAFDWQAEFPEVHSRKNPGFDAVIGNPPYVFGEYHDALSKDYFKAKYALAKDQYDTYWLFVEQGLRLTRQHGGFSLIVPDALLARDICADVRSLLLRNGLNRVYHCGLVFEAAVSAVVFVCSNGGRHVRIVSETRDGTEAIVEHACDRRRFKAAGNTCLLVHASDAEARLLDRVKQRCTTLGAVASISRGEEIGKKSVLSEGPIPIIVGQDISRYQIATPSRFIAKQAKNAILYEHPKVVIVKTGRTCIAALDEDGVVTMQSVYNVHPCGEEMNVALLLAFLNSKFVRFFVHKTFTAYKLLFPQLNQTTVKGIPVPRCSHRGLLAQRVGTMLDLHKRLAKARTPQEKTVIKRRIATTDRRIDELVYELYGLTDDEIAIVEAAT